MERIWSHPKRFLLFGATLAALVLPVMPARAADPKEVDAAKAFLTNMSRAKGVLFFCHPTATYQSVEVTGDGGVSRDGRLVPGAFHVKVRYSWKSLFNDTNTSDLHFFFDAKGRLTELQAGRTTSLFAQFSAADVVIGGVKDELTKEVAKWKDAAARQLAADLISKADARTADADSPARPALIRLPRRVPFNRALPVRGSAVERDTVALPP